MKPSDKTISNLHERIESELEDLDVDCRVDSPLLYGDQLSRSFPGDSSPERHFGRELRLLLDVRVLLRLQAPNGLAVPSELNHRFIGEDVPMKRLLALQLLSCVGHSDAPILLAHFEAVTCASLHEAHVIADPLEDVSVGVEVGEEEESVEDFSGTGMRTLSVELEDHVLHLITVAFFQNFEILFSLVFKT